VRVRLLDPRARAPRYAKPSDSGLDLYAVVDEPVHVWPWQRPTLISTGVAIELPPGYEAQVRGRSGLSRDGLLVVPGTVDNAYRGPIGVLVYVVGPPSRTIQTGDRIAQLVIAPVASVEVEVVEALGETERGASGFGSTGVR
jgi:dUTP pyrophosphatase